MNEQVDIGGAQDNRHELSSVQAGLMADLDAEQHAGGAEEDDNCAVLVDVDTLLAKQPG